MKRRKFLKPVGLLLLALLLVAVIVVPAAAQEPEGDVSTQAADITGDVLWAPNPINVPIGGGKAASRIYVDGAEQVWGVTLSVGYDAAVLTPQLGFQDVKAGSVVPGVQGSDYLIQIRPIAPAPAGHCASAIAGAAVPSYFEINLFYINSSAGPIEGSGNLIEIPWRSIAGGLPTQVCLDPVASLVVDQAGNGNPIAAANGPLAVTTVGNPSQFRVGLQGGKPSGMAQGPPCPFGFRVPVGNEVSTSPTVIHLGYCNAASQPFPTYEVTDAPPTQITINRLGYVDVEIDYPLAEDVDTVYMLAGDADNDNQVTIIDIQIIVANFGNIANYNGLDLPLVESLDYNFDGTINIIDLVIAAQNFGIDGPTDGTIPVYDL
ncbi:MAG: hypothetical protein KDJ52_08125 [Anaerolineae bacterium]|nr:hypothetical protein [Anaerolineae bacterium]